MNADTFHEGTVDVLLSDVECIGNETELFECTLSNFEGMICGSSGVVCQCKNITL